MDFALIYHTEDKAHKYKNDIIFQYLTGDSLWFWHAVLTYKVAFSRLGVDLFKR